jgi:hypothetical protein
MKCLNCGALKAENERLAKLVDRYKLLAGAIAEDACSAAIAKHDDELVGECIEHFSARVSRLAEAEGFPFSKDHDGMRISLDGAIRNAIRAMKNDDTGSAWTLEELQRTLHLVEYQFYKGNIKVVDEFLQLWALDKPRSDCKRAHVAAQAAKEKNEKDNNQ